jgi:hypothetical protein
MTLCNKVMIINGGKVKAFESIEQILAEGMTLSDFYCRYAMLEAS